MGLPGFLLLLFIGLKLAGVIAWSWFWVLAPLWITFGVVFAMFILAVATIAGQAIGACIAILLYETYLTLK